VEPNKEVSKKSQDLCAARHAVSSFAKFVIRRNTREFLAKRKEKQRRLRSAGGVKRERKPGANFETCEEDRCNNEVMFVCNRKLGCGHYCYLVNSNEGDHEHEICLEEGCENSLEQNLSSICYLCT